MPDITVTFDASHASEVVSILIAKAVPFKVGTGGGLLAGEIAPPAKRKKRKTKPTASQQVARSAGLRAILKAGLAVPTFTHADVRAQCEELGIKAVSASPTLTYFKRDGRFVIQNPDGTFTLTELGTEEARKL